MDDHEIVAGLSDGQDDAADAFVRRYRRPVMWALFQLGIPEAEREDVAQDVLVSAWQQLTAGTFQERSELFSWLYTIIRRRAADHHRRKPTVQIVRLGTDDPPGCTGWTAPDQETAILVNQVLGLMPLRLRCVFVLRFRHDLSPEAIARIMGVSQKRAANLVSEAKRRFTDLVLDRGRQRPQPRLT